MKKIMTFVLVVIIALLTICSCSKKLVYSVPTQAQVDKFILDNSINVVEIKQAKEFTVILFQNELDYGHYILYRDQNDKLYHGSVQGVSRGDYPIRTGGVASGKEPFVTVIINDEEILEKSSYVEVTFDDGNTIKEQVVGKGVILIYSNTKNDKSVSYDRLAIYDIDSNLLYEQ